MADFFRSTCDNPEGYCNTLAIKPCRSVPNALRFGIIDDSTEPDQPAFIQVYREEEWDVIVKNETRPAENVTFKSVDKCLEFPVPLNPNIENNICDCMLYTSKHLYFVEIKNADDGNLAKAQAQLSRSIHVFREFHSLDPYSDRRAYIANTAKPQAPQISLTESQKFADRNFDFDLIRAVEIIFK